MKTTNLRSLALLVTLCSSSAYAQILPETTPLKIEGDVALRLVEGVDRFLLRELKASVRQRDEHWNRDLSSPDAYAKSIEPKRKQLAQMIGVRGELVSFQSPNIIATIDDHNSAASDDSDIVTTSATFGPVSTKSSNSILAVRLTTRRWPHSLRHGHSWWSVAISMVSASTSGWRMSLLKSGTSTPLD